MKSMIFNKNYPLQVWLTSIVIAPILLSIVTLDSSIFSLFFIYIFYGVFLSVPVFLIYLLSFRILIQKKYSPLFIKALSDLLSIIGVFITFQIISGSEIYLLSIIYSTSIILSSIFCKIYRLE